ncbi:MAG: 2TM domain-containing protein [Methylocystaceae bacterium]|nr:2TM domain-containing protein [Methylocystaceae bacterium]
MSDLVKSLRREKGWTQEQLADISGLSVRTIQRIEKGDPCALDTAQALAAAFDTKADIFLSPVSQTTENDEDILTQLQKLNEQRQLRRRFKFIRHCITYIIINAFLATLNLIQSPENIWFIYPLFGWGLGLALHGVKAFIWNWEDRICAYMQKK